MGAFFVNEGIDTGDIIATREYDVPRLCERDSSPHRKRVEANLVINFADPIYCDYLLRQLFQNKINPSHGATTEQNSEQGKVHYFGHNMLKDLALNQWHWNPT